MIERARDIMRSRTQETIQYPLESVSDALLFGFSYMESRDHIVEYVIASPEMIKRIFAEIPDSKVNPSEEALGSVWTAKLLISDRLTKNQLLLSNCTYSAVVKVDNR